MENWAIVESFGESKMSFLRNKSYLCNNTIKYIHYSIVKKVFKNADFRCEE